MQKTRLGISVELLGASICLIALFGGLTPTVLLVGYVLLMEKEEWLRRCAVKALAVLLMIAFSITVIGLIPDLLSWISSIVRVFKGNFDYSFISSIISVINGALNIIKTCLLLLLGIKALNRETVNISIIDGIIAKYM